MRALRPLVPAVTAALLVFAVPTPALADCDGPACEPVAVVDPGRSSSRWRS